MLRTKVKKPDIQFSQRSLKRSLKWMFSQKKLMQVKNTKSSSQTLDVAFFQTYN